MCKVVPNCKYLKCFNYYLYIIEEEAHCYVVKCRGIVCGQYVADYSTTECRMFWPAAYKTVLYAAVEGLRAEMSCIQLLNNLLRIAHKLFAYIICIHGGFLNLHNL